MKISNRDMFVSEASQEQYKEIMPLLEIPALDAEFLKRDKLAKKAKKRYHYLGQLAIIFVASSAIFSIADALILKNFLDNIIFKYIAVGVAGLGITLQCYLFFTKQKLKWLLNRFRTERLRSLKFQTYLLVQSAADTEDLKRLTEAFTTKKMAQLENDMNAGIAVLRNFSPSSLLDELSAPSKAKNSSLAKQARDAYLDLRVRYQRNFALSEVASFAGRRRFFNSSQDMIYLGAAIFSFLSLGAKVTDPSGLGINTAWIDFLAVTLFVLGATESIRDNALLEGQSQTRFEQYARAIDETTSGTNPGGTNLKHLIFEMERICLDELDLFCRAAERISYRF